MSAPGASGPVVELLALLDPEPLGEDRFVVPNRDRGFGPRVFGGQVAAQALLAAHRTVAVDHSVHSMHAYFLRPGVPGTPITYEVDRIRDGRSFTTRTVVARQGGGDVPGTGEAIFEVSASFHRHEDGPDYHQPIDPDVPPPEEASADRGFVPPAIRDRLPMELRELGATPPGPDGFRRSTRRVWMRLKERLLLADFATTLEEEAPVAS